MNKKLLYLRYYETMNNSTKNYLIDLPKQLFRIYLNNPNESNFIALMGCLDSLLSQNPDINFPYVDKLYNKFLGEKSKVSINSQKKLVVQLALIPCANCGYELRNLINNYSDKFTSVYILGGEYHATYKWSLFRKFPYEFFWRTQQKECIELIKKADIIHIHHSWDFTAIPDLFKNKIVITTLYDISSSSIESYKEKIKKYSSFITVADQPLQKEIFRDLSTYSLPIVRFLFDESMIKHNPIPVVVFAPTIRNLGDDLPLCSKKREEVLAIIEKLKTELNFEFDLIEGIPYEENLDRKRRADIIIDDMNDNFEEYHCTSLEAACFGAVPLTSYSGSEYPFIKTNIQTLESTLRFYINNPYELKRAQRKIIEWRKTIYTPEKLLIPYETLYNNLLQNKQKIIEINKTNNEKINELFNKLNQKNIYYWVADQTLLEITEDNPILYSPLKLGTNNEETKKEIENLVSDLQINVYITVNKFQQIKNYNYHNIALFVPKPLTPYIRHCKRRYRKK